MKILHDRALIFWCLSDPQRHSISLVSAQFLHRWLQHVCARVRLARVRPPCAIPLLMAISPFDCVPGYFEMYSRTTANHDLAMGRRPQGIPRFPQCTVPQSRLLLARSSILGGWFQDRWAAMGLFFIRAVFARIPSGNGSVRNPTAWCIWQQRWRKQHPERQDHSQLGWWTWPGEPFQLVDHVQMGLHGHGVPHLFANCIAGWQLWSWEWLVWGAIQCPEPTISEPVLGYNIVEYGSCIVSIAVRAAHRE